MGLQAGNKTHLYKVIVAMPRETIIRYTKASTKKSAIYRVALGIAKKHDVHESYVFAFLKANPTKVVTNLIR